MPEQMFSKNLYSRTGIQEILESADIHPSRGMGQCFLIGETAARRIASCANGAKVLEIGPGLGSITLPMSEISSRIVAVEKDNRLALILKEAFVGTKNVEIINADILTIDLNKALDHDGEPWIAVGNLPYRVGSQILIFLLEAEHPFREIHITVQEEFADRLSAEPGTKEYSRITVVTRYHTDIERLFNLNHELFYPRPKVESTTLRLVPHGRFRSSPEDYALFKRIVAAAFSTRRKTIINALGNAAPEIAAKDLLLGALMRSGIDPKSRAEELSVEKFIDLTTEIGNACSNNNGSPRD